MVVTEVKGAAAPAPAISIKSVLVIKTTAAVMVLAVPGVSELTKILFVMELAAVVNVPVIVILAARVTVANFAAVFVMVKVVKVLAPVITKVPETALGSILKKVTPPPLTAGDAPTKVITDVPQVKVKFVGMAKSMTGVPVPERLMALAPKVIVRMFALEERIRKAVTLTPLVFQVPLVTVIVPLVPILKASTFCQLPPTPLKTINA
ncbi:MAG: hypothetical protein PHI12_11280 [Dehalococcoidales bacterium]|nr:hypothetical protein [Dehalococcoidales bacterium]